MAENLMQKLKHELYSRSNGLEAYDWQLDVSEALLLGLDCTVIAGTGAGKTMPCPIGVKRGVDTFPIMP